MQKALRAKVSLFTASYAPSQFCPSLRRCARIHFILLVRAHGTVGRVRRSYASQWLESRYEGWRGIGRYVL